MNNVTFGPMERWDSDGAASALIYVDGHEAGVIEKSMIDVGVTSYEYVTDGYSVEVDGCDDVVWFMVRRQRRGFGNKNHTGEYATARAALKAAKDFARNFYGG